MPKPSMTSDERRLSVNFYNNMRTAIKTNGRTIQDVLVECGIFGTWLNSFIGGRHRIDDKCEKIAKCIHVPIEELLKDELDPKYIGKYIIDGRGNRVGHKDLINPKICRKCIYFGGGGDFGNCNYILVERHSRPSTDLAHGGKIRHTHMTTARSLYLARGLN